MTGVRKPIKHGTPSGHKLHHYRGEESCAECHAAYNDDRMACRIHNGQPSVRLPVEVVGALLLAVTNRDTFRYAVTAIGPRTAAGCIDRAAGRTA